MKQTIYPIKLSKTLKWITIFISLTIFFVVAYVTHLLIQYPNSLSIVITSVIGVLLAIATVHIMTSRPFSIEVTDSQVLIHKGRDVVTIDRSDILEVRRKENIVWDMRIWGSNGYFGFIGHFASRKEGRYIALVQDTSSMVYIRTKGKNYVVSCVEPDKLIEELSSSKVL